MPADVSGTDELVEQLLEFAAIALAGTGSIQSK
jgi:hypothetical protein